MSGIGLPLPLFHAWQVTGRPLPTTALVSYQMLLVLYSDIENAMGNFDISGLFYISRLYSILYSISTDKSSTDPLVYITDLQRNFSIAVSLDM
jgi:hypothetical protein